MPDFSLRELHQWCAIPRERLEDHPARKVPFHMVRDAVEMGQLMARTLLEEIRDHERGGERTRAIVPCGPTGWYAPFVRMVNAEKISLRNLTVFHMDECLDWQGRSLPANHPLNFRTYMEHHFYGGIDPELAVPRAQRYYPSPDDMPKMLEAIDRAPVDITLGGWGQDGHVAYNQARRDPLRPLGLEELRQSSLRIQQNSVDTVIALAQRSLGTAWQFVPPMSITLGIRECLGARKVRVFSDTGAWKQTALRVALFGPVTPEYPMTLLQEHPDALITATADTAAHPFAEHPEWDFFGDPGSPHPPART
jgi:glucosamine-6-phosphate deaminase